MPTRSDLILERQHYRLFGRIRHAGHYASWPLRIPPPWASASVGLALSERPSFGGPSASQSLRRFARLHCPCAMNNIFPSFLLMCSSAMPHRHFEEPTGPARSGRPDDRLRDEAIHMHSRRGAGLLRFARNADFAVHRLGSRPGRYSEQKSLVLSVFEIEHSLVPRCCVASSGRAMLRRARSGRSSRLAAPTNEPLTRAKRFRNPAFHRCAQTR
jgi:hypothetical protein